MNELAEEIIYPENYEVKYYPDITFIIPAYNEEKRISYAINELCNYIYDNKLNWNIIISVDGTVMICQKMRYPTQLWLFPSLQYFF